MAEINRVTETRTPPPQDCVTNSDGAFVLNMVPGTAFPYVSNHSQFKDVEIERYKSGIVVDPQNPVELEFVVQRIDP